LHNRLVSRLRETGPYQFLTVRYQALQ